MTGSMSALPKLSKTKTRSGLDWLSWKLQRLSVSSKKRKLTIQKEAGITRHPLYDLIDSVKVSHPGLEKLAASAVMGVKACQCLIVVSPTGCG